MTERKKRTYDAARTKEIILDAAEQIFAELGYSAARIDAIASAAGYNKSLIYQYFQDKLGLYTEVVKRADRLGNQMFQEAAGDLLSDETTLSDPAKFKRLLEEVITISYQFMSEHPSYLKIYSWEAAEEWKTWKKISYSPDDIFQFYKLAQRAKENGIIRQDMDAMMVPIVMMNAVIPFVQSFRRVNNLLKNDDLEWTMSQERFREQIVKFVTHGVMEPSLI